MLRTAFRVRVLCVPRRGVEQLAISEFPRERIRNFCIVAHVDHGKSTLADRLLEIAGNISSSSSNKQVLDKLQVERERGITVKAQTASMIYAYKGAEYLLNLIDTPGHVDFSYEVSRSMAACQGAVLLVDATKGIQAQTVANFFLAFGQSLVIVPAVNKIDSELADPSKIARQMEDSFEVTDVLPISAKTGLGCADILGAVIERIPPPNEGDPSIPFRGLLFDSSYDAYQGVVCLFSVRDGYLKKGDAVESVAHGKKYDVAEVGIFTPDRQIVDRLHAGQVGYAILGMRVAKEARVGDTFRAHGCQAEALPGFRMAKPMVFSGIFPMAAEDHAKMNDSIAKLLINDSSVTIQRETSPVLGQGYRLGFLGTLHMDVFRQRLEQEFDAKAVCTLPTVPFKVVMKNGQERLITDPCEFPDPAGMMKVAEVQEPMVLATIIVSDAYLSDTIVLCQEHRGVQLDLTCVGSNDTDSRVVLKYKMPLVEIIHKFYSKLKNISSGFASLDYEPLAYEKADMVRLDVLLNNHPYAPLSTIQHRNTLKQNGKEIVAKLKENMDRQLVEIVIRASVGKDVIATERVPQLRKDMIANLYGGDYSRKAKLLALQRDSKKVMKGQYKPTVPIETYIKMVQSDE